MRKSSHKTVVVASTSIVDVLDIYMQTCPSSDEFVSSLLQLWDGETDAFVRTLLSRPGLSPRMAQAYGRLCEDYICSRTAMQFSEFVVARLCAYYDQYMTSRCFMDLILIPHDLGSSFATALSNVD